ncbi:MAG: hypothetical protein SFV15_06800 [Polyangiaceae bacterium]|nr:hypothetical protein [Polyangiaceae bacterium]
MGDKSPKGKQRAKEQKSAAKTQAQSEQGKRQAAFSSASAGKDPKKK